MDEKEFIREATEVTEESMAQFIADYPNLAAALQAWVNARAEVLDLKALNHFVRLACVMACNATVQLQEQIRNSEVH